MQGYAAVTVWGCAQLRAISGRSATLKLGSPPGLLRPSRCPELSLEPSAGAVPRSRWALSQLRLCQSAFSAGTGAAGDCVCSLSCPEID